MQNSLRRGVLVDVRQDRGPSPALYRVLHPFAPPSPEHKGSSAWAIMRRYDYATRTFKPPRMVQVERVTRVYGSKISNPLDLPTKARKIACFPCS